MLPAHGRIDCRQCLSGCDYTQEMDSRFLVTNNPCAWGSQNPMVMVLGQTKGATQNEALDEAHSEEDFTRVAFDGSRPALFALLRSLGLCMHVQNLDPLFEETENDWHWGSFIRCSVMGKSSKKPGWHSGSPEVSPLYKAPEAGALPRTCVKEHLSTLPPRLKLVLMLGNSNAHIKNVQSALAQTHSIVKIPKNEMAYIAGGVMWVHILHPSPAAIAYRQQFIAADPRTTQGVKALQARAAINMALKGADLPGYLSL